jgi:hypothetical protein
MPDENINKKRIIKNNNNEKIFFMKKTKEFQILIPTKKTAC